MCPPGAGILAVLVCVANAPLTALAWLGRQRTRAVAALLLAGMALPPLGAILKPYVTESVFVLLCIAFLRVETAVLGRHLRRPGLVIAATAWTAIVIPLLIGGSLLIGRDTVPDALHLALMLQAIASPIMSAPAFIALMGLDATLALITLVTSTAVTPVTAPVLAALMGLELTLSPLALGIQLAIILAGSALIAVVIRLTVGLAAVTRWRDEIDGINILVLFVFVAAVMGDVGPRLFTDPLLVVGLAALAFAMFFAVLGVTMLAFARAGWERAFAFGFMFAQRNMGLMLAATAGALPDLAWLYFAASQFPIYLSMQLLKPIAEKVRERDEGA
jgi:hypothetical protein